MYTVEYMKNGGGNMWMVAIGIALGSSTLDGAIRNAAEGKARNPDKVLAIRVLDPSGNVAWSA